MNVGKIIENSLKYPASNWKRLLIFGVLILIYQFSINILGIYIKNFILVFLLIIPFIISYFLIGGYEFRVIETTMRGKMEAPEFNKWPKMFHDGLKIFIVKLVYGIIPVIILAVGFTLLFMGSYSIQMVGVLILLLGVILLFIAALIMVMALSNMIYYSEISAAFKLSEIKERIKKIGWLNYILVLIILAILVVLISVVGTLLSFIPIVGLVLSSLIIDPYLYLFISRAYALIYWETLEDEPVEPLANQIYP